MGKSLRHNILLSCGTFLFCLTVAEASCRVARYITAARDFSIPVMEASTDPALGIELRRSAHGEILGHDVTINEEGFRDPSWRDGSLDDSATTRVLVVGDSIAFGYGVAAEESFPRVIERKLNEAGQKTRVYDVAVPGYGLKQEQRLLELYLPRIHPKKVIIAYCLNDPDPAGVSTEAFHILQPPVSETWYLFNRMYDLVRFKRSGLDYHEYIHHEGAAALAAYFKELAAMHNAGADITLMIVPVFIWNDAGYPYTDIHEKLAADAAHAGLHVLDLSSALMRETASAVSIDTWHPSAHGHQIIAETLLQSVLSPR